jgi:hypothetical protein
VGAPVPDVVTGRARFDDLAALPMDVRVFPADQVPDFAFTSP